MLNNIPAIIGSLMIFSSYYAKGPALLIIGRLIFGFNNGKGFAASFYVVHFLYDACSCDFATTPNKLANYIKSSIKYSSIDLINYFSKLLFFVFLCFKIMLTQQIHSTIKE